MEHFREEAVTVEDQERRVRLVSSFTPHVSQLLTRHEALTRQFYSFNHLTIDEKIENVPGFIEGQSALPIPEFSE